MDRTWKYFVFILVWMSFGVAVIFGQILPLMLPFGAPDQGALALFLGCLVWWFVGTFSFFAAEGSFKT